MRNQAARRLSGRLHITSNEWASFQTRSSALLPQVPPEDTVEFAAARATLHEFTFKEISGEQRKVFNRFIA